MSLLKVGAISSILSGFIGMKIATYANARTTLEARKGIAAAFAVGEYGCSSWRTEDPREMSRMRRMPQGTR